MQAAANVTPIRTEAKKPVGTTADRLKSFVSRVERLEEEKKALAEDIKEVYGEAKSEGFDVKVLRKCVAIRKRNAEELAEEEELLQLYMGALEEKEEAKRDPRQDRF